MKGSPDVGGESEPDTQQAPHTDASRPGEHLPFSAGLAFRSSSHCHCLPMASQAPALTIPSCPPQREPNCVSPAGSGAQARPPPLLLHQFPGAWQVLSW